MIYNDLKEYFEGKLEDSIRPGEATNPAASNVARNINLGLGQLIDCLQGIKYVFVYQ